MSHIDHRSWSHSAAMAAHVRRKQAVARKSHVDMIVKKLSKKLGDKCHLKRMVTTDRLLPVGGLRRRCVKSLFTPWISTLVGKGRVLTKKLAQQVCNRLRKHFELSAIDDDGEETRRLHYLIKSARKRQLGSPVARTKPSAMSSVDATDTLPLETMDEPAEDWCEHFFGICFLLSELW